MRVLPEPTFGLPGVGLKAGQRGIMRRILPVPPGQAGPHEFPVQVPAIRQEPLAHQPAVATGVPDEHGHLLLECQAGGELPSLRTEGLPAFRRVDAVQPTSDGLPISQDLEGVAVHDADDAAGELGGGPGLRDEDEAQETPHSSPAVHSNFPSPIENVRLSFRRCHHLSIIPH